MLFGGQHPDVAAGWMNLAMLYNDADNPEELVALARAHNIMDGSAFIDTKSTEGPRPIPTHLPSTWSSGGQLKEMVTFANLILAKYPPAPARAQLAVGPRRGAL